MNYGSQRGVRMKKVILTTESGADVPQHLVQKYGIYVVPMHVIMGGEDYLDGHLPVPEVFDFYRRTKKLPSTAATNTHEYVELFERIRAEHPDSIIVHVGYTSQASASFQSAMIAAEDFEALYLIDTLNVTMGLGAVVLYAAELLAAQPDIDVTELVGKIEAVVPKARLAFLPGSLDFLRAGGRVGNLAYIGGALLKVKPCIELKGGKLVSTRKYRGEMMKVSEKLFRDYLAEYDIDRSRLYFVYSIGLEENIKEQMNKLAAKAGFEDVLWVEAGAMISSHAGPGGFGIAGIER